MGFYSFLCKFVFGCYVDMNASAGDTFVDVEDLLVGPVVVVVVWSLW